MRGDDDEHHYHERTSRKYQDYAGDAHEDPVPACPFVAAPSTEVCVWADDIQGEDRAGAPAARLRRTIEVDHHASVTLRASVPLRTVPGQTTKDCDPSHHGEVRRLRLLNGRSTARVLMSILDHEWAARRSSAR
jgi:hypothetical protein